MGTPKDFNACLLAVNVAVILETMSSIVSGIRRRMITLFIVKRKIRESESDTKMTQMLREK